MSRGHLRDNGMDITIFSGLSYNENVPTDSWNQVLGGVNLVSRAESRGSSEGILWGMVGKY